MANNKILRVAHLYGNLMNTYGDLGNILVLKYYAQKLGVGLTVDLISLHDEFDATKYDFVLFGGGQDFEQQLVSTDLVQPAKRVGLTKYIKSGGVMLAVCGGYQLLGQYYIGAAGQKIKGAGILPHYTKSQKNHRFIGDIKIKNQETGQIFRGFENHNGLTYLGSGERPLGEVLVGKGNNGTDKTEGAIYKNVFCSYMHGVILARNGELAKRILGLALAHAKIDCGDKFTDLAVESY